MVCLDTRDFCGNENRHRPTLLHTERANKGKDISTKQSIGADASAETQFPFASRYLDLLAKPPPVQSISHLGLRKLRNSGRHVLLLGRSEGRRRCGKGDNACDGAGLHGWLFTNFTFRVVLVVRRNSFALKHAGFQTPKLSRRPC